MEETPTFTFPNEFLICVATKFLVRPPARCQCSKNGCQPSSSPELAQRYGVKMVVISAYHPQANGMIMCGHKPIVDALLKMSNGDSTNWVRNLSTVLWADWSTVRTSTGLIPYYISCGNEPIVPIELEIPTWRILPWDEVHSTSDLLAVRAPITTPRRKPGRSYPSPSAYAPWTKRAPWQKVWYSCRRTSSRTGCLHDTRRKKDMSRKLSFRWLGPYRITDAVKEKGTYMLEELDGSRLAGTFAGDRKKRFHLRQRLHLDHALTLILKSCQILTTSFWATAISTFLMYLMTSPICDPAKPSAFPLLFLAIS